MAGEHSPTVPGTELTLPQQTLDLPPLGLQTRRLCGGTAAVGRHGGNQSVINVVTVMNINVTKYIRQQSTAALKNGGKEATQNCVCGSRKWR